MPNIEAPSAEDWQGYESDADATWAHGQLFGKPQSELWQYFEADPINAMEDIYRVPNKALPFYAVSFGEFSKSIIDSDDDLLKASAASAFFKYVAALSEKRLESILPARDVILGLLLYIANNQYKYGADEHIYGNFLHLYEDIKSRLQ